jgi:hypothetical protein
MLLSAKALEGDGRPKDVVRLASVQRTADGDKQKSSTGGP